MLYSVESGHYIKKLPHKKEFNRYRARITDLEYNNIVDRLNDMIDGDEIHTAGWMPGSNWKGTVFEPIYYACGENVELSGMFFGLIVFKVMMDRDDCWGFGRYKKDGIDIKSMTYFRLAKCPEE